MTPTVDTAQLVSAIGDAVIVTDPQGDIVLWNPAATHLFGFTADEVMGRSMDLIIPERQRERHWEGYRKTMSTGQTRYGHDLLRVPALHKDGRTLSIAFTVALLPSAAGTPAAIAAVIRDETSRFADERNLRKRLAELEARLAASVVAAP